MTIVVNSRTISLLEGAIHSAFVVSNAFPAINKSTVNYSFILEVPQPLDDDEYEPFYPSEKLQIPYGMDIVSSFYSTIVSSMYLFILSARID